MGFRGLGFIYRVKGLRLCLNNHSPIQKKKEECLVARIITKISALRVLTTPIVIAADVLNQLIHDVVLKS